jgi:DNA-binding Lrp family transcriptional regulator
MRLQKSAKAGLTDNRQWFNDTIWLGLLQIRQILNAEEKMPIKAELDAIDWKILRELQDEGRITNVELSRRIGISAPPCLRRVKRLEDAGIIRGYRALLNAPSLGMDVVAFCLVGLHHQAESELKAFAERTRGWPIVRQAWMVSGESDFLLHCVASDLGAFQSFVIEELTSSPNVDTVRTALTIRQVKDEGMVAIYASNPGSLQDG